MEISFTEIKSFISENSSDEQQKEQLFVEATVSPSQDSNEVSHCENGSMYNVTTVLSFYF